MMPPWIETVLALAFLIGLGYGFVLLLFVRGRRLRGLLVMLATFVVVPLIAVILVTPATTAPSAPAATVHQGDLAQDDWMAVQSRARELDLGAYAALPAADRRGLVADLVEGAVGAEADAGPFVDCMGDLAFHKARTLAVAQVFGWCVGEYERGDARFGEHFNELAAGDLSRLATVRCRQAVREQLRAPGAADFPWVPDQVTRNARQRYVVRSHVDAQTLTGAETRIAYHCEVQHRPGADALDPSGWSLLHLELTPR